MKKVKAFGKKNQKGATLVMVVGVFSVLIIIVTATVSAATAARRQTYTQYCSNQAYYYANSALNVFVNNTLTDASLKDFLTSVSTSKESDEIQIGNNASVKYYIKKQPDGKLLVKVEGKFDGKNAYSSVLLNGDGTVTRTPTFDAASVSLSDMHFANLFFATGDIISKFPANDDPEIQECQFTNDTTIYGNIYSTGNIEFNSQGGVIESVNSDVFSIQSLKSVIFANHTVRLNYPSTVQKAFINCNRFWEKDGTAVGNSEKLLDIYCNEVLMTKPGAKIYGNLNVYKKRDADGRVIGSPTVTINGSTIYGDVYIDGNVSIDSNYSTIKGNLYVTGICNLTKTTVEGNVYADQYMQGSGTTIRGELHARLGAYTWDEDTDAPLIASKEKPAIDDPETVFKQYEVDSERYVEASGVNFDAKSYNANQTNLTIDQTGTLNGSPSNNTITVKVNEDPIWIKLNVGQFWQSKIVIERNSQYPETPVYFYVPTGKTIQVDKTTILDKNTEYKLNVNNIFQVGKDQDDLVSITKGTPNYWLLGANSSVITWQSTIEGYMYGPKATVKCSGPGAKTVHFSLDGITTYADMPPIIGAVVVQKVDISADNCGILYLIPLVEGMPGVTTPPDVDLGPERWEVDQYIRQ